MDGGMFTGAIILGFFYLWTIAAALINVISAMATVRWLGKRGYRTIWLLNTSAFIIITAFIICSYFYTMSL